MQHRMKVQNTFTEEIAATVSDSVSKPQTTPMSSPAPDSTGQANVASVPQRRILCTSLSHSHQAYRNEAFLSMHVLPTSVKTSNKAARLSLHMTQIKRLRAYEHTCMSSDSKIMTYTLHAHIHYACTHTYTRPQAPSDPLFRRAGCLHINHFVYFPREEGLTQRARTSNLTHPRLQ